VDAIAERPFILYALLGVVTVLLPTARTRALAGAGLGIAALGLAADSMGGDASGTIFTAINEVLIGLGAAIVILAAALAWRLRQTSGRVVRTPGEPPARSWPDQEVLLGLLIAAAGPYLILLGAGALLVLFRPARSALLKDRYGWLALLLGAAALLCVALFLLFTILGSLGASMAEIASGPFSPAAERLLVLLIGLASLLLSGLPPFHRAPWRLSLAPLAAILLTRILAAALPGGLGDWDSPAMLWLVAALAYGAWSRHWSIVAVAGGLISLWSGLTAGILPGCVLVLWGWLDDAGLLDTGRLGGTNRERWSGLKALVPALAAPFGLAAALHSEVLLPVVAMVAISLALVIEAGRRPRPA
jgi:hypothetical protein